MNKQVSPGAAELIRLELVWISEGFKDLSEVFDAVILSN